MMITVSKFTKIFSAFLLLTMLNSIFFPTVAFALTGGPSAPEVQSFEPIGTSQMVDVFSGDFSYNIPLLDVGGYPVNLSYHGGINTDQEASWVGLGWNINPGVINRSMRGVPDDFSGDAVVKEFNVKADNTFGINVSTTLELFGVDPKKFKGLSKFGLGLGLSYNSYRGFGMELSATPAINAGNKAKGPFSGKLGLTASSESGFGISPSVSFSKNIKQKNEGSRTVSLKIGLPFNSRTGLKSMTFGLDVQREDKYKITDSKGNVTSEKTVESSRNGGSSISFATPTYIPQINMPMANTSVTIEATVGLELYGGHPDLNLTGYYTGQYLAYNTESVPAYGYLNVQNAGGNPSAMLDINREKDGAFTEHTPCLPVTSFTNDIYSVVGQGIGGCYKPTRNDLGILYDQAHQNIGGSVDLGGFEFGAGNGAHGGINYDVNITTTNSGQWVSDNGPSEILSFQGKTSSDPLYEPVYFKQAGEKNVLQDQASFVANTGGYEPVEISLNTDVEDTPAKKEFQTEGGSTYPITSSINKRNEGTRQTRNETVSYLTGDEAMEMAMPQLHLQSSGHKIVSYKDFDIDYTSKYYSNVDKFNRNPGQRAHHISEMTAVREDGMRYVYGIPAYNLKQEESSFALDAPKETAQLDLAVSRGVVGYFSGGSNPNNSTSNKAGTDHYFNETRFPEFAYAYLLTAVLSADYVDLTGDGPTDDDLGNFTKFNYTKVSDNYKWRVPVEQDMATHDEGLKYNTEDDKGHYVYGEKEVWYLHSIETKSHIAEFELMNREDSYGVTDKNGGLSTANHDMKALKEIRLYAKADLLNNPNQDRLKATVLKRVHFVYDYSLCQNVTNNSGNSVDADGNLYPPSAPNVNSDKGKLTLKKLYFTYEKSMKGKLNSYDFEYGQIFDATGSVTSVNNPGYSVRNYDMWGNYKPNPATSYSVFQNTPSSSEFPYVLQNKTSQDQNAAAWNLSKISLPSGGEIKVNYESDDYAYVQSQRAMQMFQIRGFNSSNNWATASNLLYSTASFGSVQFNNYLFFDLVQKPGGGGSYETDLNYYFPENNQIFFRALVKIANANNSNHNNTFEYVSGYAKIIRSRSGLVSGQNMGYFKLEGPEGFNSLGDKRPNTVVIAQDAANSNHAYVNPITRAAWNYAKLYMSRIAYGQNDVTDNGVMNILKAIAAVFKSIQQFIEGFNRDLLDRNFGKEVKLEKSWVRLNNPIGVKLGGGSRVKKIAISDKWSKLVEGTVATPTVKEVEYGQTYDYTMKEGARTISSGVASWEPALSYENPYRVPVTYKEEHLLAPDDDRYMEEPFGESYFPSPSVGYRRVTVKNIARADVHRNATGSVVHEFYTAYDYPTITRRTTLQPERKRPFFLLQLLKLKNTDFMTGSQGFYIENNDMHGKQKAQWVYQEGKESVGEEISGVEYFYKEVEEPYTIPLSSKTYKRKHLDNQVSVLNKYGANYIQDNKTVGVDYDFIVDMREEETTTESGGMNGNLDAFLAAILPVAVPIVLPHFSRERVRFRSAVTVKNVYRYGLIDHVVAHDLGSKISTSNLLYDATTGEVLLTQTVNEFDDPVYNFKYPAHLSYDRMGPAYKNIGVEFENVAFNAISNATKYFIPGDELYLQGASDTHGWVSEVSTGGIKVIDRSGNFIDETIPVSKLKIVRSGRRNMSTMAVGSIVSLKNPIAGNSLRFDPTTDIINASSVEFSDNWRLFCECGINPEVTIINPFVQGIRGNWRQVKSYLHLTGRSQSRANNNTNVRRDGLFTSFTPFWTTPLNNIDDWKPDPTNWTFTAEATEYSPYGFELESKDALDRYSAAIYGYNNIFPTAVSSNAKYTDIAFDSFEDYDFGACVEDHFSYKQHKSKVALSDAHSGRRSMKVQKDASNSNATSISTQKVLIKCATNN